MRTALLVAAVALSASHSPQQILLSLTGETDSMSVTWTVKDSCAASSGVSYGTDPNNLNSRAKASTYYWSDYSRCIYTAIMSGLALNTEYTYLVDGADGPASFYNQRERSDGQGRIYAIYADFGLNNDMSLDTLIDDVTNDGFDTVIHAGDFAYNLEDHDGETGDDFMKAIQPIAGTKPYMGSPGNHEADGNTFKQYTTRLAAYGTPASNSNSSSGLWYSFNDGLVHWVSLDTELWYYGGSPAQIASQLSWLKADLASVDRRITPWVIAFGHKQWWMDKANFTQLEAILQAFNTDLYFCGHQHNYQRLFPQVAGRVEKDCVSADASVYENCSSMTTVVVGSPGCDDGIDSGSAASDSIATFIQAYGYGHLQVFNATHAHWQWEEVASKHKKLRGGVSHHASVQDSFWVIKNAA